MYHRKQIARNPTKLIPAKFFANTPGHISFLIKHALWSFSRWQVSTNVFVGAYIDRLLEKKPPRGGRVNDGGERNGGEEGKRNKSERSCDALNFELFVHVFWAFSSSAPRSEKEEGERVYVLFSSGLYSA